jgi:bifunctional non-homologous end joining protein LigD
VAKADKAAEPAPTQAPLANYRSKRTKGRTPEPIPSARAAKRPRSSAPLTFVIQEHHATALHWDFRLEHDGVLASWALPKGLPLTPDENHLAVHVEDHPFEYGKFEGTIPAGEYGGGTVSIWDHGTYDLEKWRENEVMVVLHGKRATGRFVLFPTHGNNWMIHRMDPAPEGFEPLPATLAPMLASPDELPDQDGRWAYEFKWDGIRALVWSDGGRARALSRNGNDITAAFPELRQVGAAMGSHQVVLDGELVVFDETSRPSFSRLAKRIHLASPRDVDRAAKRDPASLILFDLLHLDGRSTLGDTYDERRRQLEELGLGGVAWAVTPSFVDVEGTDVLTTAVELGMEGVVAKRRTSTYRPGVRSNEWVKVKAERTQEAVIGGWTEGKGNRRSTFGALLLGIPSQTAKGKLTFIGKVGTGFSDESRASLLEQLGSLVREAPPFDEPLSRATIGGPATWVRPALVGEVRFSAWTPDGHLRHPVWRGVRADKSPKEVSRES